MPIFWKALCYLEKIKVISGQLMKLDVTKK